VLTCSPRPARAKGFSLIELMVVITVMAVMLGMLAPNMSTWIANNRVRGTAESLASELRLAQLEALRRNRQVVFALTNGNPSTTVTPAPAASGLNWFVRALPLTNTAAGVNEASDANFDTAAAAAMFVHGSNQARQALVSITLSDPLAAMLCFNALGRPTGTASSAVGGVTTCAMPTDAATPVTYTIARTGADRSLQVQVSLGGQIRLCDPNKSLAGGQADACS